MRLQRVQLARAASERAARAVLARALELLANNELLAARSRVQLEPARTVLARAQLELYLRASSTARFSSKLFGGSCPYRRDLYIRPSGGTSTETSYHTLKYLYNLQSTKIDEM